MSLDTVIVMIVFFFLAPLLSALGPWLRRRLEALATGLDEGTPGPSDPVGVPAAPVVTRRTPTDSLASPVPMRSAETRAAAPRPSGLPGLRTRSELRRSVVLMAVLGPCRAMDPP